MGFLTVVVIHNDALHAFDENPAGFGRAILDGIDKANEVGKQISMGFGGYANYINVEPSRHADHEVLFLSGGGCVRAIGAFERAFEERCVKDPEHARGLLKKAKDLLKWAKERLDLIEKKS